MSRAVTTTLLAASVGLALMLPACSSGSGHANPVTSTSACPLLAQLAQTGQTVARADVGNPAQFDATLRTAVADYVRITRRLRGAVPARLQADVDRLTAAAQQYRFQDAITARAAIDTYARSKCGSTSTKASG